MKKSIEYNILQTQRIFVSSIAILCRFARANAVYLKMTRHFLTSQPLLRLLICFVLTTTAILWWGGSPSLATKEDDLYREYTTARREGEKTPWYKLEMRKATLEEHTRKLDEFRNQGFSNMIFNEIFQLESQHATLIKVVANEETVVCKAIILGRPSIHKDYRAMKKQETEGNETYKKKWQQVKGSQQILIKYQSQKELAPRPESPKLTPEEIADLESKIED